MIRSLLIANRGEIACRIIRTARAMGIPTVAVYSDADADALHVRQADQAVHIGPSPARESYLVGERIIAAAKATGAEAIHPGYGFLSENAEFAEAVTAAGLIWVGATPHSIRAMGLKDAAKRLMAAAGVPVTPGYLGDDQSPDRLHAEADAIGYPVLIKAVAGGGGKGMRRVEASADFPDALASCKREAASSFGDDRVILEKYILSPRHIEVQVFGDTHGNVVHLFERDCSLQRRHQKVIEEAPAPGMSAEAREAICAAAVRAAQAVDYVGAGTIEFIADASEGLRADRTWFMEMNTRLQVEHPVTEEITGVDLVEWQLRIASGEPLPKRQDELSINGHAIEARLYAEDPAKGFLPSIGPLKVLDLTDDGYIQDVRIETGVVRGGEVSSFYDPMIAKIVVHRSDREMAAQALADICAQVRVAPVRTNAGFLSRCLLHPDFMAGALDTGFIARHENALITAPDHRAAMAADAAHGLFRDALDRLRDPAVIAPAFRLNADPRAVAHAIDDRGIAHPVDLMPHLSDGWRYFYPTHFEHDPLQVTVFDEGEAVAFTARPAVEAGGTGGGGGAILAPMPGRVTAVEVTAGQSVAKGQRLLTLEAMKMEHALTAPFDGVVAELNAAENGQVIEGTVLVRVERAEG
jgi:3-methylcrotonyl-CoA carboxylase alpha subunit